jgi:hypothetical protein
LFFACQTFAAIFNLHEYSKFHIVWQAKKSISGRFFYNSPISGKKADFGIEKMIIEKA